MLKTQRLYVRLQQHLRICRNPHRCSTLPQVSKISLISPFVWTLVECCEFLNTERKTFSWIKFAKIIPGSPLVVYLSSKSFRWLLQKKKKKKKKRNKPILANPYSGPCVMVQSVVHNPIIYSTFYWLYLTYPIKAYTDFYPTTWSISRSWYQSDAVFIYLFNNSWFVCNYFALNEQLK